MHSSPDRHETLTYAQMEHILTGLFEASPGLFLVVFAGGEPTLLGDDLMRAIRFCKSNGRRTRIVTNGYWARSMESARDMIGQLSAAGLDELNISTDDFHLPFISLQRVRNAFEAGLEGGFDCIAIATCSGQGTVLNPESLNEEFGRGDMMLRFDEHGVVIEHEFDMQNTNVMLSNADVQRLGRGDTALHPSEVTELDKRAWQDGCPWAVRSASISARGHFVACCGFETDKNPILDYGDAMARPVGDIIDDADADLITNMIALIGPPRIRDLLQQICPDEVSFTDRAVAPCEVCQQLVTRPENRQALYGHLEEFVPVIVEARRDLMERHTVNGRVQLPDDAHINVGLRSTDGERVAPDSPV